MLAIAALCAIPASSRRRLLTGTRAARAAGAAASSGAAKGASLKAAISQSIPDVRRPALLATLKQQNDIIAGNAAEAYHVADGIRIVFRRGHPIARLPITR